MNTQEREQLSHFLQQLAEVRLSQKDHDAEEMIRQAVAAQPDAAYLLVQRALLQDQALNGAKRQIADLQAQLQAGSNQHSGGFLNNDPWAQTSANAGVPGAANYQISRYAPPAPASAQAAGNFLGGGAGFLGNVATTAAGVVAGSFLFQGIENLLGHHHGHGWGQTPTASGEEHASEYTTINNYYGDDATPSSFHQADYQEFSPDGDGDFQDDGDSGWI